MGALQRVKALDAHENNSPMTLPIKLARPDIIPPAKPVIAKYTSELDGVHFEWKLSSSQDVEMYYFQRKQVGVAGWKTMISFPPTPGILAFVDGTASARKWYQYRLIAQDDAKLRSSSRMVKAKPFDNGVRPPIQFFAAQYDAVNKTVALTWKYENDPELIGFEVFRAIEDSTRMRSFAFLKTPTSSTGTQISNSSAVLLGNIWACTLVDRDLNFNLKQLKTFGAAAPPPAGSTPITPNQAIPTATPTGIGGQSTYTVSAPNNMAGKPTLQPGKIYYWVMAKYFDGAYSPLAGSLIISL